jgi:outer membrane protein TolC
MQASEDKNMSSKEKIIDLQERVADAEACYQKSLSSFGAHLGDIDEVIRALRDLWDAKRELECAQVREACETVKLGGPVLFEQLNNLPIM